jgi:multiple sugar transport system permease protein
MTPPVMAGVRNWLKLTQDRFYFQSVLVTLQFVLLLVPLRILIAVILGVLLDKIIFAKKLYRAFFFAPVVTSAVALSFVMRALFAESYGVINFLLGFLGIQSIPWLTNPMLAVTACVMFIVWQGAGQGMVIILAGLQSIPPTLYEAADIDGARNLQKFFRITLPMLTPYIFFLLITNMIASMQIFDQIYVLTRGGPGYATTTLVYFIVTSAFKEFQMGYSAVLSLTLLAMLLIVTIIQWKNQERWVFYG